jgi:hypothetical protein
MASGDRASVTEGQNEAEFLLCEARSCPCLSSQAYTSLRQGASLAQRVGPGGGVRDASRAACAHAARAELPLDEF